MLLIATAQISFAQQAIAKIKFEEAEEAFAANNYEETVAKLIEVETILKSTNPRVLYLKITAQSKIIEKNPTNDYKIIESTRKLSAKYLKDYEDVPNNEDKYRDIYKIAESLKKYPKSEADFLMVIDSYRSLGDSNYYGKGIAVNYSNALHYYNKMILLGDKTSSLEMGNIYLNGFGVEKDYQKAFDYYLISAENNNKYGQNQLGYMLVYGLGVERNFKKAKEYFRLSANQGYAIGQYNFAELENYKSTTECLKYLRLAADQNDMYAQAILGNKFFNGEGVEKNYAQGLEYYKSSANQGLNYGKFLLGLRYFEGKGIIKDKKQATLLGYSKDINYKDIIIKDFDSKHIFYSDIITFWTVNVILLIQLQE